MSGIVTFESVEAAQRAGFEVCADNGNHYLVRKKFENGYALAVVPVTSAPR